MKKILCLLCALVLASSLLAACGKNATPSEYTPAGGFSPNNYEFSADWPENEFAKQVPKPKFKTDVGEPSETELTVACAASVDQLKVYVESLIKAGFTENADTTEESAFGMAVYIYTASNADGYTAEVNYSNMLGSTPTLKIKKPI